MTKDMLIVAAGMGTRLSDVGISKPLVPLLGVPLIERVIATAHEAGITRFVIVTGHLRETLEAYLEIIAQRYSVEIEAVYNPDYRMPNGHSVMAAKGHLPNHFLLAMCDHMMDAELVAEMASLEIEDGSVVLGVDRRLDNPHVDLQDVTRVKTKGDHIDCIGKLIDDYDAFDTGIFHCTPGFFDALQIAFDKGHDNISGGMMELVAKDMAWTHTIGDYTWIDVDDTHMFELASKVLPANPVKKKSA